MEKASYVNIASTIGMDDAKDISFLTDNIKEADAAKAAGWTAVLTTRPGNPALPADARSKYSVIDTLSDFAKIG